MQLTLAHHKIEYKCFKENGIAVAFVVVVIIKSLGNTIVASN